MERVVDEETVRRLAARYDMFSPEAREQLAGMVKPDRSLQHYEGVMLGIELALNMIEKSHSSEQLKHVLEGIAFRAAKCAMESWSTEVG
jgi:hypothetical protein